MYSLSLSISFYELIKILENPFLKTGAYIAVPPTPHAEGKTKPLREKNTLGHVLGNNNNNIININNLINIIITFLLLGLTIRRGFWQQALL